MFNANLLKELKQYKKSLSYISICILLSAFSIIGFTGTFAKVFASLFIENINLDKAAPFIGALLCLAFFRVVFDLKRQVTGKRMSLQIQESIRHRLAKKLTIMNPVERKKMQTGDFLSIATNSVDEIDSFFSQFIPQIMSAIIFPFVFFIAAIFIDFWSALIFFVTAPLLPFLLYLIGRMSADAAARQWQTITVLSRNFFELLQGLVTLKIFNRSQQQLAYVDELSEDFSSSTLRVLRIAFLSAFALELVSTLSIAIIAVSIGLRLLNNDIGFYQAFFLLLLAPEFYRPLRQCGAAFHQALTASTAAAAIYDFLQQNTSVKETAVYCKKTQLPYSIRFEQVTFSYDQAHEPALRNVSFSVDGGKMIALAGNSGAGKSTIFQLFLLFVLPQKGKIFINDIDAATISPLFWRSRVSYVPQNPYIFRKTAGANIDLAGSATFEAVKKAAKAARLHDFIMSLPQGYETIIDSSSLSGGQCQRFGIARAFLQDRPIVLFDEPTAHADPENEKYIMQAIEKLTYNKTTIIAAHRLSTIRKASSIFVFADGVLRESGTHDELLQNDDVYARLSAAQGGPYD